MAATLIRTTGTERDELRASFGITRTEAKSLRAGAILNCLDWQYADAIVPNADGTPARFKVTSVKTWKTQPDRVEVHVKRGMREYHVFEAHDLHRLRVERA